MNQIKRVAVLGGGVAGLQAAKALRKAGFQAVIFEKANDIGGVWRSNYEGFGIQVPKSLYEFPDYRASFGDFADGPSVHAYVKSYASKNRLLDPSILKLSTEVEKLDPLQEGGWNVKARNKDGLVSEEKFDFAVVSTGLYQKPFTPQIKDQELFKGKILHSTEMTDALAMCKDKRVVILGSGKSAIDCAVVAATQGQAKSTTLVFRKAHWAAPHKIAGLIPFQYVFLSRFGQALVSWHVGAWPTAPSSVHSVHNAISPVMRPIFRIVEELFAFQHGQKGDLRPQLDIVEDFYSAAQIHGTEVRDSFKSGKVVGKKGIVSRLKPDGVVLEDGSSVDADVIILGTGFKPDYSTLFPSQVISQLDIQPDGLWLYRSMVPVNVPRLAFIGCGAATISNIGTYGLQSEWLARLLKGEFNLPNKDAMNAEVTAHKLFARKWMPDTGARSSLVLLHQTHYHDQLCKDMREPHRRKGANVLAELFMPYIPADYEKIVA